MIFYPKVWFYEVNAHRRSIGLAMVPWLAEVLTMSSWSNCFTATDRHKLIWRSDRLRLCTEGGRRFALNISSFISSFSTLRSDLFVHADVYHGSRRAELLLEFLLGLRCAAAAVQTGSVPEVPHGAEVRHASGQEVQGSRPSHRQLCPPRNYQSSIRS